MTTRFAHLKHPAERRQLALVRSSAAIAVIAGVIGLSAVTRHVHTHEHGAAATQLSAPAADWPLELAPIDMGAEIAAAEARARLAATNQPMADAADDDPPRSSLYTGEPGVF